MDYKWTIKDLRKKARHLERLIKKENDEDKVNELLIDLQSCQTVISALEISGIKSQTETPPMSDIIRDEYDELCDFDFLWPDLILYSHHAGTIGLMRPMLQKTSFTKDDIVGMTHDFYKTMSGPFFYEKFLKSFATRSNHLRFSDNSKYSGQTMFLKTSGETFIESQYNHEFYDLATLIHEYGHAIHFTTNALQQLKDSTLPYHELVSKFFEILSYDYFLENGWDPNDLYKAYLYAISIELDDFAILAQEFKIIKIALQHRNNINSVKNFKRMVSQQAGIPIASIGTTIESRASENLPYMTSSMLNLELIKIYHNDPERALYILQRILEFEPLDAYLIYEKIKSLGITPLENSKQYFRELKKDFK